jgi:NAD(P)-dependent dehydrogenase (short-subunit alcohol dehydrogenase family)
MTGRLDGKGAVVAGGGQTRGETIGNGRATSLLMAREGARVVVADRNLDSAQETVDLIVKEGGIAWAYQADVTEEAACVALAEKAQELLGKIDILQNNVGIFSGDGPSGKITYDAWQRIMNTNLTGMWLTCKHVMPFMQRNGAGSIVNISSIASLMCAPRGLAYSLSKVAVNGLTHALARENAHHGIRVNAILPGLVDTPLGVDEHARISGLERSAISLERAERVPMGRQGTAWDVAYASLFFASDEAAFITGAQLVVDGGQTLIVGSTAK